jgi:CheY-like chemotaxis protein
VSQWVRGAAGGCREEKRVLENISGDTVLTGCRGAASVLLLDDRRPWPLDLIEAIAREGYTVVRASQIERVPSMLLTGGFMAFLICARPLGMRDRLVLKRCRELSPEVGVVVTSTQSVKPDLKQALESGATAFLSWPSPPDLLRKALMSGTGTCSSPGINMPGEKEMSARLQGGPSGDQEN